MPELATQKRPGGRKLARMASRSSQARSREISNWAEFRAASAELRDSNASRNVQLWQAIGLAMVRTDLIAKDLNARIVALESELAGKATAKATTEKPLRLSLWRAIDDASVAALIDRIESAHGREIKLSIESPGGEIAAAQRVAAAIERHGQIDATAISKCDSAATIVFAACRRRGAIKNASFFFHRPTFGGQPAKTPADARRLDRIAKDMSGFIAKRCGGKPATFLRLMGAEGRVVSALKASDLGLINATIRRPHVPRKGNSK
jgi:ATP-dependent protease ClpP protease subunit